MKLENNSNLNPAHYQEIVESSGVSPEIAELNFRTITDPREVDELLDRNTKRRWQHSGSLAPCWAAEGVDPKTGESWGRGVQIKPDTSPMIDGKPQKYLGISGAPSEPLFLRSTRDDAWPVVLENHDISILITEGPKKAACAISMSYAAISLPGVWNGQLKGRLKPSLKQFCVPGRKVYLAFDSDWRTKPEVVKAIIRLSNLLKSEGCIVYIVLWSSDYKGIDDFAVACGDEAVRQAIAEASTFEEWTESVKKKESSADVLHEIASKTSCFVTPDGDSYADVTVDGYRQTHRIRSRPFRLWLLREYCLKTGKPPTAAALADVVNTIDAIAYFSNTKREVYLRVASHEGKYYLDLGTDDWSAIEVDETGWRVVHSPPVRFRRPALMLPLPIPVGGGSVSTLKELLNVGEDGWVLVSTFLLYSFRAGMTYPILFLNASKGSGKTSAAETLRGLIDPGKAGLIKPVSDTHKLAVAASNRWLMVFDNVSYLGPELSDDLCRLSTGFGFSTRTLFETMDETCVEFTRPMVLTAIDGVVARDDLADRVITVNLEPIPPESRLLKSDLDKLLEAARPEVLGAFLTAFSETLAALPTIERKDLPRMADYGLFSLAAEQPLGFEPGSWRKAFDRSATEGQRAVVESSPIGEAVIALANKELFYKDTPANVLGHLGTNYAGKEVTQSKGWPKAASPFMKMLSRIKSDLLACDVEIGITKSDGVRWLSIKKIIRRENDEPMSRSRVENSPVHPVPGTSESLPREP